MIPEVHKPSANTQREGRGTCKKFVNRMELFSFISAAPEVWFSLKSRWQSSVKYSAIARYAYSQYFLGSMLVNEKAVQKDGFHSIDNMYSAYRFFTKSW